VKPPPKPCWPITTTPRTAGSLTGTGFALDPVGVLVDTDMTDPENPVSTPIDGWHLNLRVTDDRPDPASEYAITPTQQRRVWL
jgi:hypothetical protein